MQAAVDNTYSMWAMFIRFSTQAAGACMQPSALCIIWLPEEHIVAAPVTAR